MAINENIVTGRKFRRLINKETKLWQRISWWTKSSDVEFNDGKTAEQKLGNINGITSDPTNDRDDLAASIRSVYDIDEKYEYRLGGARFIIDENSDVWVVNERAGADAVPKKLGQLDEESVKAVTGNDDTDEIINKGSDKYTVAKGTWMCAIARNAVVQPSANSFCYYTDKYGGEHSVSNPEINSITEIIHSQSSKKANCFTSLIIYFVKVNTETADVTIKESPSTVNASNVSYGRYWIKLSD